MNTQTAIKTTVQITWTNAPLIRMSTNVDMPEYGLLADQTFYLARSSKNNGDYYISTWDYDRCKWMCRCPAYKPCRHEKTINADCHKLAATRKAAKLERAARLAAQRQAEEAKAEAEVAEVLAELDTLATPEQQPAELLAAVNAELAKVQAEAATQEEFASTRARAALPNDADQIAYFIQLRRRSDEMARNDAEWKRTQDERISQVLQPVPTPTVRNVSESWLLKGSRSGAFSGRVA